MKPAEYIAIATLIFGSSVLAAWLQHWLKERAEKRIEKREVAYLALRLATKFERYAEDAISFVERIQDFVAKPSIGYSRELPALDALPDEKERWRDLRVDLTAEVLGFDAERRSQQGWIDFQYRDEPEAVPLMAVRTALVLGAQAYTLASKLRDEYDLPEFDTETHWVEFLWDEYDQLPAEDKRAELVRIVKPKSWSDKAKRLLRVDASLI